ncbi:CRISPR-associated helicase Cas3' [Paracoccus jiaweipingae]|uniref:CRISPR-associated helicase Cas3' n=1 Tax=unclassified Paracoccus (in: a-proteobacteria) TaxID=2688777 RepID=UPI0037A06BD5
MTSFLTQWPGKSAAVEGGMQHQAACHMLDVAAVAEILIAPFGFAPARSSALILLTALHDLGKIGNGFRTMLETGRAQPFRLRHWGITEILLRHHDGLLQGCLGGGDYARDALYAAVAGHHGAPPTWPDLTDRRVLRSIGDDALADSGDLIQAFAALWPDASLGAMTWDEARQLSWWLPGFVAAADWIGSNTDWFPARPAGDSLPEYLASARIRAQDAVRAAGLAAPAPSDGPLFDFQPRPMQAACATIALPDGPALAIIEDETGAGKTEAALILAQRMMQAGKGRGLYIALPTTATADAMFGRARQVVRRMFRDRPSLTLAHSRAALSDAWRDLKAPQTSATDEPVCTEWLADNRRRALLGTVGVGTVDQALLSVLPTRYNTLRHFALSSKILIVDEVHELGAPYMAAELVQLLKMHRQAGGSAILLTATLPLDQRRALLAAWGADDSGDPAYPALSMADAAPATDFPQTTGARGPVTVRRLDSDGAAIATLTDAAAKGAACLWVRNAVDDAIAGVQALRAAGVPADLLHARFALDDRLRHEQAALDRFGKDGQDRAGRVLVATQVVESSLDLDLDVMVSDLAPMASLIQRAGRLWRHMDRRPVGARPVPMPVLHVVAPDPGDVADAQWLHHVLDKGAWVYPLDAQWRTARVLFETGRIEAPSGLRALIEAVHGPDAPAVPAPLAEAEAERIGMGFAEANQARRNMIALGRDYRGGGGAAPDTDYPTRLGRPTRALVLVVAGADGLRFYAGEAGAKAMQLSEVQVAQARLAGLDLPDQATPAIAALKAQWPDWQQAALTVCPLGQNGVICTGLRYDPALGLVFDGGAG